MHFVKNQFNRLSGNLTKVQEIQAQVNAGDLDYMGQVQDVHNLTGAFKQFFRDLEGPLIPWPNAEKLFEVYDEKSKSKKVKAIIEGLSKLPTTNFETLKVLLLHLEQVEKQKNKNKMDAKNLATVFGPCLTWRPQIDPAKLVDDMAHQKNLADMLISNVKNIYEKK